MKLSRKYQWEEMPGRTKIGVVGYHPRMADTLVTGLTEKEALEYVDKLIKVYKEKADPGEKLGFFIDRIGLGHFIRLIQEV